MCRLAAYAGPPAPLSCVLFNGPHSLEHQAYQPRELQGSATVNVDGTGLAWWPAPGAHPVRYATEKTPWADANLRQIAGTSTAPLQMAAVRSATPGLGFGPENVSPFTSGRLAGSHNGAIGEFRGTVGRRMVSSLSDAAYSQLDTLNDSKVLFLLFADQYERLADLPAALVSTVQLVREFVNEAGTQATLNLAVGDGESIATCRAAVGRTADSLYWLQDRDHVIAASEPFDDRDEWTHVPEGHLVHFNANHLELLPIEGNP